MMLLFRLLLFFDCLEDAISFFLGELIEVGRGRRPKVYHIVQREVHPGAGDEEVCGSHRTSS